MNRSITLSAGEWRIMERLWERSPRTLTELVRELGRPYRGVPLAGSDLEDARRQLGEAEKNPARYPYHTAWFLVEKSWAWWLAPPTSGGRRTAAGRWRSGTAWASPTGAGAT